MTENARAAALRHVQEAIDALSVEVWRGPTLDKLRQVTGPDCTIAEELDRVDRTIGPRGASMFGKLAECVREAVVALYMAKAELESLEKK